MSTTPRVAVIVDTFPRWSERFIAREFQELARRGIDFKIFCLNAGDDAFADDPDFAGLIARRIVLPRCFLPNPFARGSRDPLQAAREKAALAALGMLGGAKLRCAGSLVDVIRAEGCTHVYAHFANLPSTLGWLAAGALKLPFALSVHARDLFVEPQCLAEKLVDARRVFTCHQRAFEHVAAMPNAAGKAVLMRHGVPLKEFPFCKRAPEPGARRLIINAGRMVEKKGLYKLISALSWLNKRQIPNEVMPKEMPPWRAAFYGDGPDRKKLWEQVKSSGLESMIAFHPPYKGGEAAGIFSAADLFVAPSYTGKDGDVDGVPNAVLEAMAIGVPVVAFKYFSGGISELDGAGAIHLVDEVMRNHPSAQVMMLAAAIGNILNDPAGAATQARLARTLVEARYDGARNIAPLLEFFQET